MFDALVVVLAIALIVGILAMHLTITKLRSERNYWANHCLELRRRLDENGIQENEPRYPQYQYDHDQS